MKTQFKILFSAAALTLGSLAALGQSDPAEEVPGDNFSLEGALELFKKSASPQEFEQLLNSPNSKVNNLDLNGDGEIDYIRVIDRNEGNVHAFILQALVDKNESQDVAVIELEKRGDGSAVLQIVGDADIYGIETIIEPTEEVRVNAGASTRRTVVNVWAWPSVQYVYGPSYTIWASPWGWNYYPGWYRPWRPIAWGIYDPFWAPYRPYYSVAYRHRIVYAPVIYRPYRSTAVVVHNRYYTQIDHFRNTSRGYRYDRSDGHARNSGYHGGSRSNYTTRTRSDYSNGRRSDYSNNGRTRSDFNASNGRSGDNNSNSNSNNLNRSNNSRSNWNRNSNPGGTRSNDFNNGGNRSTPNTTPTDRGSFRRSNPDNGSRSFSRPEVNRTPQQRSSQPQRSFTPSPQRQSAPQQHRSAPQGGGGSGGGNSGGGGHRRH